MKEWSKAIPPSNERTNMITELNAPAASVEAEKERTKQVSIAGWTAGTTAFFGVLAVANMPSWPTSFGVAAICAMVAVVCLRIVKL